MKPRIPLTATLPSDRELRVSREFDAPCALVFKAYTDPALVQRWLWGPNDWPMAECEIDLRVGGTRTRVTTTVLYSSKNARDNAMKTPMLEGWAVCFERLDDRLPDFAA